MKRVTLNLTDRGEGALKEACDLTGDNATDAVNRALRAYVWFLRLPRASDGAVEIIGVNGRVERHHVI
jgi:hypothetical protein